MCRYYNTPQGVFSYKIQNDTVIVLSYDGDDYYLTVPEAIDGFPVTEIAAKAFLGKRQTEQLILPSKITHIEDWAFAHMTALKVLSIPRTELSLGRQVFLDCPLLTEIKLNPIMTKAEDCRQETFLSDSSLPFYLAAVVQILKNPFLFTPQDAGSPKWYQDFDKAVCHFLSRPDDEGFEPVYLGWFEDEDVMATQYPRYIEQKQLNKAALVLRRLKTAYELAKPCQAAYENYLLSHLETGVWNILCTQPYLSDCEYLKILLDLDAVKENHIDRLLSAFNSANACEAAAMLLQYQETHLQKKDFWNKLEL